MKAVIEIPDIPAAVRSLRFNPPLTDAEFEAFCGTNEVYRIERTREGVIQVVSPTGLNTGGGNANVSGQLYAWWSLHRKGQIFDSNTGYYLPDGSMLSPDASFLTEESLALIPKPKRGHIPHASPDFVIELISETDTLAASKRKMTRWMENGVQLGWLVEPRRERVWVYLPNTVAPDLRMDSHVMGSGPVEGFRLNLDELWAQYR